MEIGVFMPVSGFSASRDTLIETVQKAETWGYDAAWTADRLVIPWTIETPYPYAADSQFIVPPDRPFLECMTVLSFLAGVTSRIKLGVSVLVMPYRQPLHWLRIATTIDTLSQGRLILGVGIGWMEEEFASLGADITKRGRISDEQLEVVHQLLTEEHSTFHGEFYDYDDIAFLPKAYDGDLPIWVGGEAKPARVRAGRYGDSWFPYFVRMTPGELKARFEDARTAAADAGRDPDTLTLNCCLPVEITETEVPQEPDRLRGTVDQVTEALSSYAEVGVGHVGLQFMVPRYPERIAQIEAFAAALPALKS